MEKIVIPMRISTSVNHEDFCFINYRKYGVRRMRLVRGLSKSEPVYPIVRETQVSGEKIFVPVKNHPDPLGANIVYPRKSSQVVSISVPEKLRITIFLSRTIGVSTHAISLGVIFSRQDFPGNGPERVRVPLAVLYRLTSEDHFSKIKIVFAFHEAYDMPFLTCLWERIHSCPILSVVRSR